MPAFKRSELADLNVFMTIVRRRSFRQAAIELAVSTSALSHAMKALELRLGVKLLNRTSRSVVPTAAGGELAARLERGFQTIGDALGDLEQHRASPMGRLRINVPRESQVDMPFVMAMQLARFILVLLLGPLIARRVARWTQSSRRA